MGRIIGIDIGGSTTKIVGLDNGVVFSPFLVKATDPVSSIYGAFGRFLNENKLQLNNVERVMITGVGSTFINEKIFGIPTYKVTEFNATGLGGLFLSKLKRAVIVSMGTGTAYVMADNGKVNHLGGTGVGGGTLLGLANLTLNIRNFDDIVELAKDGDLRHVDLTINDISHDELTGMPSNTTASNFGKIIDRASKADIAIGIINLVFQSIGVMAVFASRDQVTNDIVLTGNLTTVPQAKEVFDFLTTLHNVKFHMPANAEYATAAGAAIIGVDEPGARPIL